MNTTTHVFWGPSSQLESLSVVKKSSSQLVVYMFVYRTDTRAALSSRNHMRTYMLTYVRQSCYGLREGWHSWSQTLYFELAINRLPNHCTATIVLQTLHCNHGAATIVLQPLHCNHGAATMALQPLHCNSRASDRKILPLPYDYYYYHYYYY